MAHDHAHALHPDTAGPPDAARLQRRAMAASLGIAVLMLVGKLVAYRITGSTAIFSDALESVVHIAATAMAGFSLWYASQPPDPAHPYGHGKVAYFSSGVEGALILVAALAIGWEAVGALLHGAELQRLGWGVAITGGLGLVNLALGWSLIRIGRQTNAIVLVANGHHVLTDMWTSLGVVAGIALVWATGLEWLDPVVALLLGANILWTSTRLLRDAVRGLMERVDPDDTRRLIEMLDGSVASGAIAGHHHVRHRRVNDQVWIEQHVLLPDASTLVEAHERVSALEARQRALFPESLVQITTHLEPASHHHGADVPHDAVADARATGPLRT